MIHKTTLFHAESLRTQRKDYLTTKNTKENKFKIFLLVFLHLNRLKIFVYVEY